MIDTAVMPDDIAHDVRYTNQGRRGDAILCELRLAYLDETKEPAEQVARRHAWVIAGGDWDPAEARGETNQLEEETRARYLAYFLRRLNDDLRRSKTVLARVGGGLVRRRA